ncbi:MBOAT family O-acyltransferase [Pleionea sediminis]|uniref:MBOAT family O-acyltransferase n=1 Tax=Pleionea sediminis TaxID=2569479 RepID=UPI00118717CF|nr:MBOAT family O-acyltransferase [Pleionea sediminis]
MLFNSIDFLIFLPIVFALYWLASSKNIRLQNIILIIASYVFYGWWDWRFLSLILISTVVDYTIGRFLDKTHNQTGRRLLLFTSITVNLGLLGFFKYYNFFVDSFVQAFTFFGFELSTRGLDIILPVGISFYTFQTLSYTIDIYRRKLHADREFLSVCAFVSFFPQLVAGPIERATHLLHQFDVERKFSYTHAVDGMRQILWGFFKKIVIADNCAIYANMIFNGSADLSGGVLLLGAIFFAFQIYGDFSGYSDIAIGTARLFGFELRRNFAYPYFSRDISEFWRRWHISLSSWFRDYVYIPLGGSRVGQAKKIRNVFVIFLVSGFWHGANWTFIIWGALHALYYIPILLADKNREYIEIVAKDKLLPTFKEFTQMSITFLLVVLAWVFFRAENMTHAISYLSTIFSVKLFDPFVMDQFYQAMGTLLLVSAFMCVEWLGRDRDHPLAKVDVISSRSIRWIVYLGVMLSIYMFGNYSSSLEFIYFQF